MIHYSRPAASSISRRSALGSLGALAASLALRSTETAASASPDISGASLSIQRYRKILCGEIGEDILWWFTGDFYLAEPNSSVVPIGRPMTVGVYRALGGGPGDFRYSFREAGVILDLDSGEPLRSSPLTHDPIETPLVDEPERTIEWRAQDDGSLAVTNGTHRSTLHPRWTVTSDNVLMLETQPTLNAFGLVPSAAGSSWSSAESTRTVYARRKDLERSRFVPASMIYNVSLKLTPSWLGLHDQKDRWIIVRGLGIKSRSTDIVNPDTLRWVKQHFPASFLPR